MCVLHPGVQPSTWYVQASVCRQIERDLAAATARESELRAENERLRHTLASVQDLSIGMQWEIDAALAAKETTDAR